jgi:glycosyltransferase involved in cell wall biosynthesis
MSKKPRVSILTSIYNCGFFIREAIKSVLEQTYHNWEWIIIDDGSTDSTREIIESVKDKRIRYIYQDHGGFDNLARTFNKALNISRGDLIALLDGDDCWLRNKLEAQVDKFQKPGIVLCYGECYLINKKGRKIGYWALPEDPGVASNNPTGSALRNFLVNKSCFLINSTVMIRKKTLERIGGFVEIKGLGQDYPTFPRLALEGRFAAIPACLGYYRKHSSQTTINTDRSDYETAYLLDFISLNEQKLKELGIVIKKTELEGRWNEIDKFRSYNNAMHMLMVGYFKEARTEFKKFLEYDSSIKSKLIYFFITFATLVRFDVVNPVVFLKAKTKALIKRSDYHTN